MRAEEGRMRENWRRAFKRGKGMKDARKETSKWKIKKVRNKGGCEKGKRMEGNEEKKCKRHVIYT